METHSQKLCYVITPYGKRTCRFNNKKGESQSVEINFEDVFNRIIKQVAQRLAGHSLRVIRSKDEKQAGGITEEFIRNICNAEIAIIDITDSNPNVFYELGLRHAFRPRISVVIAAEETREAELPFDIRGERIIYYSLASSEHAAQEIAEYVQSGLKSTNPDSPVHKAIPGYRIRLPSKKCTTATYRSEFLVRGGGNSRIGIKAGDLINIRDVEVWVNPENTNMEMARMCDNSVSGVIRFHGAVRNTEGWVTKDLIQEYIWEVLRWKRLTRSKVVAPKTVVVTEPGELAKLGVKKLLHVATYVGEPGSGYLPVKGLDECITRALEALDKLNSSNQASEASDQEKSLALRSVLFPVFGASAEGLNPEETLSMLVAAACDYVRERKDSNVSRIYFQAYTEDEWRWWNRVMEVHDKLEKLSVDSVTEDVKPALRTDDPKVLAPRLIALKQEAKALREKGDLVGANERLKQGMVEGLETLDAGGQDLALAKELADCFGMLGGNLNRLGDISGALAVYEKGRNIEMGIPGLTMTYNTVNLLVTRLLNSGWSALHDPLSNNISDLAEVNSRLTAQVQGDGKNAGSQWAWADLGMCEFLRRNFGSAEEAYTAAAELATPAEAGSMLDQLLKIEQRWPPQPAAEQNFYRTIQRILNLPKPEASHR